MPRFPFFYLCSCYCIVAHWDFCAEILPSHNIWSNSTHQYIIYYNVIKETLEELSSCRCWVRERKAGRNRNSKNNNTLGMDPLSISGHSCWCFLECAGQHCFSFRFALAFQTNTLHLSGETFIDSLTDFSWRVIVVDFPYRWSATERLATACNNRKHHPTNGTRPKLSTKFSYKWLFYLLTIAHWPFCSGAVFLFPTTFGIHCNEQVTATSLSNLVFI